MTESNNSPKLPAQAKRKKFSQRKELTLGDLDVKRRLLQDSPFTPVTNVESLRAEEQHMNSNLKLSPLLQDNTANLALALCRAQLQKKYGG